MGGSLLAKRNAGAMRKTQTALVLVCLLAFSGWVKGSQQSGGSGAAAQDSLNRAADAALALKSARFSLKREGTPAVLDEKHGATFTVADCVYSAPDRVSCDIKASLKNGKIVRLTRVWVPEGTFQSNPLTNQFGKVPPDSNFNGAALFARTGIPDILKTAIQQPEVVGRENIQNRETLHLKGEVSGGKLNPSMGSTLKPGMTYPVDLWVDEKSAAPVQIHFTEPEGNGWLIDFSGTDEPINIPTPRLPPPPELQRP
jgi:LppX/LprAFG-like lipoprotein